MIRFLPYALQLLLVVFCLFDCVQAVEGRVRNLPKWAWLLLIILIPIVGPIAWLLVGRPTRDRTVGGPSSTATGIAGNGANRRPPTRPKAPDDDPEFLRSLKRGNTEHEDLLRQWEEDLKRREDEFRKDDGKGPNET